MDNHNLCHNNDYLQRPQNELKPSLLKKHWFFSLIQFGDENVQKRTMQCLIRKYSLCGIDTHTASQIHIIKSTNLIACVFAHSSRIKKLA